MLAGVPRLYDAILVQHLDEVRQMAFIAGPRQVGKTTTARGAADDYLDWDNSTHRSVISAGPDAAAAHVGAELLGEGLGPVLAVDEIHKWAKWKGWLKGLHDTWKGQLRVVVTGSARLDVYRRGGDSLMGRYFLYRMHPLSVAELVAPTVPTEPVRPPRKLADEHWRALLDHGGFPEPYARRSPTFTRRWRSSRRAQLTREDARDSTRVQEIAQLGLLAEVLEQRSATSMVARNLAGDFQVAPDTIKRWVGVLESLHHGFLVRPWSRKINKSLLKEPRWFVRDWSIVEDQGRRAETLVACHLLKAVEGWTDLGLGDFALHYLRDKVGREVDFAVIRDGKPWMLIEVKQGRGEISPALRYFQARTGAPHAFTVVLDAPFVKADCFARKGPVVVPARTLLSQLV
jgi:predicted AAA+ superfamily ATPase